MKIITKQFLGKRQVIIISLFALIFGLLALWSKSKPGQPAALPSAPVASTVSSTEALRSQVEFGSVAADKLTDPFALRLPVRKKPVEKLAGAPQAAATTSPLPAAEPKLEGIWIASNLKVAFISGQALTVGDSLLGWAVVSITRERVVLQKDSRTKTLKLEER